MVAVVGGIVFSKKICSNPNRPPAGPGSVALSGNRVFAGVQVKRRQEEVMLGSGQGTRSAVGLVSL